MNLMVMRAELEEEQAWRRDEIRHLKNRLGDIRVEHERKRFRRSMLLMLYAHFEGYVKTTITMYVRAINVSGIQCKDARPALVAGAWTHLFKAMESGDKKSIVFKAALPNDESLHRFARRREFVEKLNGFYHSAVVVDDEIVNTESNLWPIVLKKLLFTVGLEHTRFERHDSVLAELVHRRNGVSHGADREGIDASVYDKLERAVFYVMEEIMELVIWAVRRKMYRK